MKWITNIQLASGEFQKEARRLRKAFSHLPKWFRQSFNTLGPPKLDFIDAMIFGVLVKRPSISNFIQQKHRKLSARPLESQIKKIEQLDSVTAKGIQPFSFPSKIIWRKIKLIKFVRVRDWKCIGSI